MAKVITRFLLPLVIICISIVVLYCSNPEKPKPEEKESTYLNLHDTVKYVGMNQCRLCHQSIYDSFLQTGMGQSFEVAGKQKSSARFDEHALLYDKTSDFYYRPFWQSDSLKILEFRLKGKDTVYKRIETVNYIIGSGQHTNSHILNNNGYLHQMPMTFYTQKGQWDLPPGFEGGFNTRFSRKIGLECMSCHNSLPDFVMGSENKYEHIPNGINCERCHGPGEAHVKARSTGSTVDTSLYIDYTIVNPGKLPIDLQFDVCQRCHLQGNAVLKNDKSFFDFKPGMKLSDVLTVFLPKYKGEEDKFIMASHADRLKMSPCFIKSFKPNEQAESLRPYKSSLTCVTCHNPHLSVKLTEKELFNSKCKNCHSGSEEKICSEDLSIRKKNNDNCFNCHMPKSNTLDIPHVTSTDHYIRKPVKKKEKEEIKKFLGLYAINETSPSAYSKAEAYLNQFEKFEYTESYLDSAAYYLSSKSKEAVINNFHLLVRLEFIKLNYSGVVKYVNIVGLQPTLDMLNKRSWDNADAWTIYRIGESLYNLQNFENAYTFYKKAISLSPYNMEFKNKLGSTAAALSKTAEAKTIFEEIIKEYSKYPSAYSNLGYLNLLSGNISEAEKLYNKALSLDPDYENALMNKVGLYLYQKKTEKAKEILEEVIKKHPGNNKAKLILQQLD